MITRNISRYTLEKYIEKKFKNFICFKEDIKNGMFLKM